VWQCVVWVGRGVVVVWRYCVYGHSAVRQVCSEGAYGARKPGYVCVLRCAMRRRQRGNVPAKGRWYVARKYGDAVTTMLCPIS